MSWLADQGRHIFPQVSRVQSLRSAFWLLGTGLSCLAVLLIAALVASVAGLRILSSNFSRTLVADRAAMEIQYGVFRSTRSHQLFGETGDPKWEQDSKASEARLVYWLETARSLPMSADASRRFASLDSTVEALRRNVLDVPPTRRTAALSDILQVNEEADAFLVAIKADADATIGRTARWSRVALVLAAVGIVLVGLSVAAVSLLARRVIYLPVVRLRSALEAHRSDARVRIPEDGPREFRAIGADVNDLFDRVAAQRERQLTFVSGIAHDLRNPMTALRTAAQLAARRVESESQRRQAERLMRQVDRMNRLVEDLLDVTRVEAGRFELRLETADLRVVVRDACELYEGVSDRHVIRCDVPEEAVRSTFDESRISQVLGNLVGNAIKYSPAGGDVEVRLAARGGWAIVEVEDQGLGISAEDRSRIFEPFRRGTGAAADIPGVGLGLSVSRRLVRAQGGEIEVESTPGAGSTFRMRLPLA